MALSFLFSHLWLLDEHNPLLGIYKIEGFHKNFSTVLSINYPSSEPSHPSKPLAPPPLSPFSLSYVLLCPILVGLLSICHKVEYFWKRDSES